MIVVEKPIVKVPEVAKDNNGTVKVLGRVMLTL